ncbi:MAG: hypothetical protein H6Q19_66 [Bacteroidetes bacterium]|nr:hypothetical protein [Bacteroidota bacterium]
MEKLFIEVQSNYNFDQTVEKLTETILSANWKVSHVHDLQETMRKNKFDVLPVKVLELCKPAYSVKLLEKDDERIYSSMMPCRISVYNKSDGYTYVSLMNSGMMAAQLGGVVELVMTDAYFESRKFIQSVIVP